VKGAAVSEEQAQPLTGKARRLANLKLFAKGQLANKTGASAAYPRESDVRGRRKERNRSLRRLPDQSCRAYPIMRAPSAFARTSPFRAIFSIATRRVSAAIQSRFIAPPTNSKAISAQQQPRQ
jgi:hypothetical protein